MRLASRGNDAKRRSWRDFYIPCLSEWLFYDDDRCHQHFISQTSKVAGGDERLVGVLPIPPSFKFNFREVRVQIIAFKEYRGGGGGEGELGSDGGRAESLGEIKPKNKINK